MSRHVERNLDLVWHIAVDLHHRVGRSIALNDLVGFGNVGLVEAAYRYDSRRGKFRTFARYYVNGAIVDGIRKSLLPRRIWAAGDIAVFPLQPYDAPSHTLETLDQLFVAQVISKLHALVDHLPHRQRAVIRKHYWDDKNLLKAGQDIGLSKSQASRLHAAAIRTLRKQFNRTIT